jgi:hypothetical protein
MRRGCTTRSGGGGGGVPQEEKSSKQWDTFLDCNLLINIVIQTSCKFFKLECVATERVISEGKHCL